MKRLIILLPAIVFITSCTKEAPTADASVSFTLNGKLKSSSGAYPGNYPLVLTYINGKLTNYAFDLFYDGGNSRISISDYFHNSDSLTASSRFGTGVLTAFSNPSITLQDTTTLGVGKSATDGSMIFNVTSLSDSYISGTFSGIMVFRNPTTSLITVRDTITNGVFTNMPIKRRFP